MYHQQMLEDYPERDVVSAVMKDTTGQVAPPVFVKLWALQLSCGHEELRVAKDKEPPKKALCGRCPK
jgi:hypothetical protein